MPVTAIQSKWDSGNLVFHDKGNYGAGAEILKIAQAAVTIGTSTNSVALAVFETISTTISDMGNDGRGLNISTTSVTPAMSDGYGVVEIDATISGTATGWFSPLSSWVNITGSGVAGTGGYICAQQNGVYADSGANTSSTIIFGMRAQALLTDAPGVLCPFSLNTANRSIDALFHIAAGPSAGLVNGTMSSSADGTIPLVIDAGGSVRYVHVYPDRN